MSCINLSSLIMSEGRIFCPKYERAPCKSTKRSKTSLLLLISLIFETDLSFRGLIFGFQRSCPCFPIQPPNGAAAVVISPGFAHLFFPGSTRLRHNEPIWDGLMNEANSQKSPSFVLHIEWEWETTKAVRG